MQKSIQNKRFTFFYQVAKMQAIKKDALLWPVSILFYNTSSTKAQIDCYCTNKPKPFGVSDVIGKIGKLGKLGILSILSVLSVFGVFFVPKNEFVEIAYH